MDVIIVRTKLQALIALELVKIGKVSKNFIFISWVDFPNMEKNQHESFYDALINKSFFSLNVVETEGFIKNFTVIYLMSLLSFFTSSKFFFAIIDSNILALTKKLNPFLHIETFDDGIANIIDGSEYFGKKALQSNNTFRRRALNLIFPRGCKVYIRNKIKRHFTIYKDTQNIVDRNKLQCIDLDYSHYLIKKDKNYLNQYLKKEVNLMVGTTFDEYIKEYNNDFIEFIRETNIYKYDLIISHPRDFSDIRNFQSTREFESPAESIINFFLKNSKVNKVNLFHFRSSCIIHFKHNNKINLIDLWTESGLTLWDDPSRELFKKSAPDQSFL